jgi:hypothetical protein
MLQKIKELKVRFRYASKKDMKQIDDEIDSMALANPEEFSSAMLELLKESVEKSKTLQIK